MLDKIKSFLVSGPVVEAVKEFFRVMLLAVVPLVISYLEQGQGIDYRAMIIVAALAGLRFIDKLLHEYGVDEENENLIKGLTRF